MLYVSLSGKIIRNINNIDFSKEEILDFSVFKDNKIVFELNLLEQIQQNNAKVLSGKKLSNFVHNVLSIWGNSYKNFKESKIVEEQNTIMYETVKALYKIK